jgi:hypothetical protein
MKGGAMRDRIPIRNDADRAWLARLPEPLRPQAEYAMRVATQGVTVPRLALFHFGLLLGQRRGCRWHDRAGMQQVAAIAQAVAADLPGVLAYAQAMIAQQTAPEAERARTGQERPHDAPPMWQTTRVATPPSTMRGERERR